MRIYELAVHFAQNVSNLRLYQLIEVTLGIIEQEWMRELLFNGASIAKGN